MRAHGLGAPRRRTAAADRDRRWTPDPIAQEKMRGLDAPPQFLVTYCATQTLKRSRSVSRLSAQNLALMIKAVFMFSGLVGRSGKIFGFVLAIASLLPGP